MSGKFPRFVQKASSLASDCPWFSRNRALGVLTLGSRVENSFSPENVNFLVRAAGQAAIAAGGAIGE
jgi:hypothetical protein